MAALAAAAHLSSIANSAAGGRAAAALFVLGLPGSAYLYQGEELGLHEVADLDDAQRQDPTFFRSAGVDVGRDGCRVPLAMAIGRAVVRLRVGRVASAAAGVVRAARGRRSRRRIRLRRCGSTGGRSPCAAELRAREELEWVDTGREDVLWFRRPGGWEVITNFGSRPFALDDRGALLASAPRGTGVLGGAATLWLRRPEG